MFSLGDVLWNNYSRLISRGATILTCAFIRWGEGFVLEKLVILLAPLSRVGIV